MQRFAPGVGAGYSQFDFSRYRHVVIAVSGGSDSLALLLTFDAWRRKHCPDIDLLAVTIDHALRTEAALEAGHVAALCMQNAIAHRTLRWNEASRGPALSQRAREARYALLAQAATDHGSGLVLTGHTLDDQFETHLMRKRRSKTGYGLSAMAPATLYQSRLWIGRPLLGIRREALRDWLRAHGQHWIEDPSNEDMAYERVRMRGEIAAMGADAQEALAANIAQAQQHRLWLAQTAATMIERHASITEDGKLDLALAAVPGEDRQAAVHAFRVLLACAGGTGFLPDESRVQAVAERTAKEKRFTTSLSRCVVHARDGHVTMWREMRDLPVSRLDTDALVWDGRFHVARRMPGQFRVEADERGWPQALDEQGAPVKAGTCDISPVAAPFQSRLSALDWPLAHTVLRLLKAAELPLMPYRNRNNAIVLT